MNDALIQQLPKALRVKELLKKEIASGKFGPQGSPFISVREIAARREISLKTAQRVMTLLKEDGVVVLNGNKYDVAIGRAAGQSGKSKLIGMTVTNLENPFFAILSKEAELAASRAGMRLMLASSNYEPAREKEIIQMFISAGAEGIISCSSQDSSLREFYETLSVPFVLIGRRAEGWKADAILAHNYNAGKLVAAHFIESGRENFGYFGIRQFHPNPRFDGFLSGLAAKGFSVPAENIVTADPKDFDAAGDDLVKMLSSARKPLAVFCFHDLLAAKFVRVCASLGLKIPGDVAVCGFDNLSVSSEITPSLTTVAYPISDMAALGVERLKRKMSGEDDGKVFTCYLEPSIVARESTAAPKTGKTTAKYEYDFACAL